MDPPTVGFIGLGHAGYAMAANLPKAGYKLIVKDADSAREIMFTAEYPSSRIAVTGPDAFADCEVIITMLPNGKVVHDALVGPDGIARGLQSGSVVVDVSSSSPWDTRLLGEELKALSIDLVDSPITQEYSHAIDAAGATLMVGSDAVGAIDKAMPVLKAVSKYQYFMGKLGAGHAMKALNNYTSAASMIALCDSLVVGQKMGLDPQTMVEVMNAGTGRNFSSAYSMKDEGLTRNFHSGYQLELLIKDLNIARDVIRSVGFETALPDMAIGYLGEAMSRLAPGADHTECLKDWERRSGITLKQSGPPEPWREPPGV